MECVIVQTIDQTKNQNITVQSIPKLQLKYKCTLEN